MSLTGFPPSDVGNPDGVPPRVLASRRNFGPAYPKFEFFFIPSVCPCNNRTINRLRWDANSQILEDNAVTGYEIVWVTAKQVAVWSYSLAQ